MDKSLIELVRDLDLNREKTREWAEKQGIKYERTDDVEDKEKKDAD